MITRRTARSVNVFAALVASAALMAGAAAPASASLLFKQDFTGGFSVYLKLSGIVILPPAG